VTRLLVAVGLILLSLPVSAQDDWTPPAEPPAVQTPAGHRTGAHFSVGRNFTLSSGDTATGAVVVVGGIATIDGHVEDDVVVIGGELRVGPTAEIDGDATAVGGHVTVDPMARVHGDTQRVGVDWPRVDWPRIAAPLEGWNWGDGAWRAIAIGWTGARLITTLVFCVLMTLVFPRSVGGVAGRIDCAPIASFGVGFLAQLLFVPALVVISVGLVITIIGIAVLVAAVPVLVALVIGAWVVGFAAASATLGASLRGVIAPRLDARVGDVVIGFLALTACTIVGQVLMIDGGRFSAFAALVQVLGTGIEYVAWTVGLGAAVAVVFGRRRTDLPPPLPTIAVSPKTF
jgi:hypothetical protein